MKNLMDKLSTYAALVGVVTAIGGGFYAWGEFNTRLQAIEGSGVDISGINVNAESIASIEAQIEGINNVNAESIASIEAQIEGIKIPDTSGISENSERIAVLEKVETTVDTELMKENEKKIAVALKELELIRLEIQELKLKSSNPLAN
jgi:cell division protein YceG involved in septum cleavage